jgi:hypothetical protein
MNSDPSEPTACLSCRRRLFRGDKTGRSALVAECERSERRAFGRRLTGIPSLLAVWLATIAELGATACDGAPSRVTRDVATSFN